ncbi:unnamed protein product [Trifolium pratense]|uniref:Uncharacterized protein n=1 Tax=Trifolium pratense TaxID=57577 RepID=A0ACB0KGT8_TRIPR|nr:unnamed protein product [Trifolium pratense]
MIEQNDSLLSKVNYISIMLLILSKFFLSCFYFINFCIIPCVARNHLKSSISSVILGTRNRVVSTSSLKGSLWMIMSP